MLDTIVFRIHGIDKYSTLIKNLDVQDVSGYTSEIGAISKNELLELRKQGFKNNTDQLRILKMNANNQFLIKTQVKKTPSSSGHYMLSHFVNYTKDYVEFNFSIPKYLYGHNVQMFADHFGDKEYNFHECVNLEHNIKRCYDRLMQFLKNFFKYEFLACPVDYKDVEVNRIDVSFNQIFRSKNEALQYLEYQKRLKKKFFRDEDGLRHEYPDEKVFNRTTSLMYVTKRYSAKIYHKGSEYAKHDAKQHAKINKRKKHDLFKIPDIQALADRTLRYELTIRNTQLNYLHKTQIFRRKCPYFQAYYKVYTDVLRKEQRNERIAQKLGKMDAAQHEAYMKENPYEKISKEERYAKKIVSHLITKKTFFLLAVNEETDAYNRRSINADCNAALFSKGLLMACLGQLLDFMHQFEVKDLPPEEAIRQKIQQHNKSRYNKLPEGEMMRFYAQMIKIGSFKEAGRIMQISRATLYRYKKRFKKIGIGENNLIPLTPDGLPNAPFDFRTYHEIMTYTTAFRYQNPLFRLDL